MTDSVRAEEEEQRLRERLKNKSQKRRESQNTRDNSSSQERDPDGKRLGGRDRSFSPPRHRRDAPPYDDRDRRYGGGGRNGRDGPGYDRDRRLHGHWRGPPPNDFYGRGPPPRGGYRGGPYNNNNNRDPYYDAPPREDPYGRDLSRRPSPPSPRDRGGGGRRSRSVSRSRSYSPGNYSSDSSRSGSPRGRRRHRGRRRSSRRSRSRSRSLSASESVSDSESSRSSVESTEERKDETPNLYTKDQRTVFLTQLVQRTVERDIKRYFSKMHNIKVNEVILLRDKRTGRHKGCAYVELRRMEDVPKAVGLSNVPPNFQRFPILIKASEAEKNYVAGAATTALTASQMGQKAQSAPLLGPNGKLLEAQKVYVGSLDPSVTQEHLFVLFSQFGQLEKVSLQVDSASGSSKGFAFLSFRDPKEAFLAIQTMGNQVLAGRPMKTGWAVNQIASLPGAEVCTSDEFPPDSSARATNAYKILAQLTMGIPVSQIGQTAAATGPLVASAAPLSNSTSRVPTVAEARATLAASGPVAVPPAPATQQAPPPPSQEPATDPSKVGNADKPTNHILVHNMFDKDQETEDGWENDIKEEFEEECSKFGKILKIQVMSKEIGGKIHATFDTVQGAQNCASSLAGRWFDKRRLQVEFVQESDSS